MENIKKTLLKLPISLVIQLICTPAPNSRKEFPQSSHYSRIILEKFPIFENFEFEIQNFKLTFEALTQIRIWISKFELKLACSVI